MEFTHAVIWKVDPSNFLSLTGFDDEFFVLFFKFLLVCICLFLILGDSFLERQV